MKTHLIKTTGFLTISNVLTRVLGMLFFVILARMFSVADYGFFRYLITVASLFAIAFTGFPTALTHFLGKHKDEEDKKNIYFSNTLFMVLFIFIILIAIILVFNQNPLYLILFLFFTLIDFFYIGLMRGLLDYVKLFGFKLVENAIQLAILIVFYFLYKNINFTAAVIFYSFSGLLSLIIFEFFRKSKLKFSLDYLSKEKIKELIQYTLPVILGSVGWTIMFSINIVFIEHFLDVEQVGFYSVGMTLSQVFTFLPAAISTIAMPKVAGTKNKGSIKKLLGLSVIGNLAVSAFILFFLLIFDKQLISLIFGAKYLSAIVVLLYLSLGQIFISTYLIYTAVFQGIGKPFIPSIILLIGCVMNLIGSYTLIPLYGIVGASMSNAVASFITFILIVGVFYLRKWT